MNKTLKILSGIALGLFLSACASTDQQVAEPSFKVQPELAHRYDRFNQSQPEFNDALFVQLQQADAAYDRGDWILAEQSYEALTQKVPRDGYAWFRLGNVRLRQGQLGGAATAYQASLQRDPDQVKPFYNLSTVYLMQSQQALESMQQKMQPHDPGHAEVERRMKLLQSVMYRRILDQPSPISSLIDLTSSQR